MIKWFAYIAALLIFAPSLLLAKVKNVHTYKDSASVSLNLQATRFLADTTKSKKQEQDDKKKIKEVANARKQPRPEKLEPVENPDALKAKERPKRQRRPVGLERPPEIPRRNGN